VSRKAVKNILIIVLSMSLIVIGCSKYTNTSTDAEINIAEQYGLAYAPPADCKGT
jgi:hypothetical protein